MVTLTSQKKEEYFYHLTKVTILKGYESSSNFFHPFQKNDDQFITLLTFIIFIGLPIFLSKKVRTFFITIQKFIVLWVVVQFFRPSHKKDDHFIILLTFIILIGSSNFFDPLKIGRSFLSPYAKSWFCWVMSHRPIF